jgi:hypothetical protein
VPQSGNGDMPGFSGVTSHVPVLVQVRPNNSGCPGWPLAEEVVRAGRPAAWNVATSFRGSESLPMLRGMRSVNDVRASQLGQLDQDWFPALFLGLIRGPTQFGDDRMPQGPGRVWLRNDGQAQATQIANGQAGDIIVLGFARGRVSQRVLWLYQKARPKYGKARGIVWCGAKGWELNGDRCCGVEKSSMDAAVDKLAIVNGITFVHCRFSTVFRPEQFYSVGSVQNRGGLPGSITITSA